MIYFLTFSNTNNLFLYSIIKTMLISFLFFLSINYISFEPNGEKSFNYLGTNEEIYLKRGKYQIKIYGAQGGRGYGDGVLCGHGGKGALITANFYITSET